MVTDFNMDLYKAAKAYQELLVYYRINKRPTEKLFAALEKADKALREVEFKEEGKEKQ